jgi:hypothetical protein
MNSELWNELATQTPIYQSIRDWNTCTANVLANKIKKVETFSEKLTNSISQYTDIEDLYLFLLRTDFKELRCPYHETSEPETWSVNILKERTTEKDTRNLGGIIINCGKYQKRTTNYLVKINREWLTHYTEWILSTLAQMKERLEQSRIITAKKEKEHANQEVKCECGGKYKLTNKSHHLKTKGHLKFIGDL